MSAATISSRLEKVSTVEEFIPAIQQVLLILYDELLDSVDLICSKAMTVLQPNRVEPELRLAVVPFDVQVRRLVSIARIKEESVGASSKYGRHYCIIPPGAGLSNHGSP